MKDLEKQIGEAAINHANEFYDKNLDEEHANWCNRKDNFELGAKSQAAKAYWQNGMHTTRDMCLNMQYYMEYCQQNGYVTPMDWIETHKHF